MDKPLPLDVDVYCSDGLCGRSVQVVIDPIARTVTHLVVADNGLLWNQHLVGLDQIAELSPDRIRLQCASGDLSTMRPFLQGEHTVGEIPYGAYEPGEYSLWPSDLPDKGLLTLDHDHMAAGELTLERGASIVASDGPVGTLDELLIDPATERITHLVLREGHLWGQKTIAIPVTYVELIAGNSVSLSLTKEQVGALPAM